MLNDTTKILFLSAALARLASAAATASKTINTANMATTQTALFKEANLALDALEQVIQVEKPTES